jgi:hypothetical protein
VETFLRRLQIAGLFLFGWFVFLVSGALTIGCLRALYFVGGVQWTGAFGVVAVSVVVGLLTTIVVLGRMAGVKW